MLKLPSFHILALAALFTLTSTAFAATNQDPDYTQIGHNVNVGAGQQVGDVTCVGCSIHIRGTISGDATTIGGSIYVEDQGQVSGDVTSVAGSIRLGSEAKVKGDATVVGGEIRRAAGAQVSGDVTSVGGTFWGIMILICPLLILGLIIALVIWLVQRNRGQAVPAAAA